MKLINLTPHPVTLIDSEDTSVTIPPSGRVAGCSEIRSIVDDAYIGNDHILEIYRITYKNVYGVPEPEKGTIYLTSAAIARVLKRPDVFAPGPIVHDEKGRVLGARGLASFAADPAKRLSRPLQQRD